MTTAATANSGVASAVQGAESPSRLGWRRFRRNRFAMAASALVLLFVVLAVFAPWIAPQDPNDADLLRRLQPPVWMPGG